MSGYIPYRTKEIVKDHDVPDGSEPFKATIITSLSFAEIDAIKINPSVTYIDLFTVIAPYIVKWNAMGRVAGTTDYEPLPPPAEAGAEILQKIDPADSMWLARKLRTVHAGGDDLKKELTPADPTHGGPNEPDSESLAPEIRQPNHLDLIG